MKILTTSESLSQLESVLDSSPKAYYVRFGDVDILLTEDIEYKRPLGKDRIVSTPKLMLELREGLRIDDPLYMRGVSGIYETEPGMVDGLFASFSNKDDLNKILEQRTDTGTFFSPVLFHYLGVFKPMILRHFITKYIEDQPKMFIGCCSHENMEKFFGKIDIYIETPSTNSYGTIDEWWPEIEQNYKNIKVVLACTGQASRVIAKRLWNLDADVHCLDFGSIVDPIDNRFKTRTCWEMKGKEVNEFFIDSKKNNTVIYTAIFGKYDELRDPTVYSEDIDYICFTDNPKLSSNIWQIRLMKPLVYGDPVRSARLVKICPHRFLDEYDYSLWVDGNMTIKIIPDVKASLNDKTIALMKHYARDCIYAEGKMCQKIPKDDPDIIERQLNTYRDEEYPENAGLYATGIIARAHKDEQLIVLSETWWKHVYKFSRRDQLSFPVVFKDYPISEIESSDWTKIHVLNAHQIKAVDKEIISQSDPFIDVRIPYEPGPHLGKAYNRAMETVEDWALLLDHDVLVRCNSQWYEICQQAIREVGHDAGFITCVTNRIGNPMQSYSIPNDTDDIQEHFRFAEQAWNEFDITLEEIPPSAPPFSGLFILTHKRAWKDVGGVIDGFYGVDNDYSYKIDKAGYKRYVIKGLYVYHAYRIKNEGKLFSGPDYKAIFPISSPGYKATSTGGNIKLTSEWRGHKPGEYLTVTPGQKAMILTLQKGIEI